MSTADKLSVPAEEKPATLGTADVRYLLNHWSRKSFFRVKRLGDRISMIEVNPQSSYTFRLQTQYEDRTVSPHSEPYAGGAVDDRGIPPDPGDIPMPRPSDFQERTERVAVPHTERVSNCPRCSGRGTNTCGHCHGFGRVDCPWCNGTGYRTRTETRMEQDAQGNPTSRVETIRENCTCFTGKVQCTGCSGTGTQTCANCRGAGRIKTSERLTVHFHCPILTDVLHGAGVPNHLLRKASGEVVVDERAAPTVGGSDMPPEIQQAANALLQRAQPVDASKSRILLQWLHVERVQIQEVLYQYSGSSKRLWIYGNEQHIYAPGVPRPWGRLAAILGGALLVVGAILYLLVF